MNISEIFETYFSILNMGALVSSKFVHSFTYFVLVDGAIFFLFWGGLVSPQRF